MLDARRSSFDTVRHLVEIHSADYLFTAEPNLPKDLQALALLALLDRDALGGRLCSTGAESAVAAAERTRSPFDGRSCPALRSCLPLNSPRLPLASDARSQRETLWA